MGSADAIRAQVVGFLKPGMQQLDQQGNVVLTELSFEDYNKVRLGFACANCLAEFTTYTIRCPVCGNARDLERDLTQAPDLWQQAHDERYSDLAPYKPSVVNPFDDHYGQILKDPDVEHIPLSKLKRSKWGRG